jgi:hypothetical protein
LDRPSCPPFKVWPVLHLRPTSMISHGYYCCFQYYRYCLRIPCPHHGSVSMRFCRLGPKSAIVPRCTSGHRRRLGKGMTRTAGTVVASVRFNQLMQMQTAFATGCGGCGGDFVAAVPADASPILLGA